MAFTERATLSGDRRFTLLAATLLAGAALLAYANSFSVPLILDDWVTILHNPSLRNVWPPWLMLAPPETTGVGGRPVANASFVLNYAATGLSLHGLHAVNLAIHVGAGLALFGVVRRTLLQASGCVRYVGDADGLALIAAALWVLHPLQTESITYVSQRTEALMGLFYFLTLYAFIRSVERAQPRRGWQAIAVLACAAGVGSKEGMVTAPVMIFLYDVALVTGSFAESGRRRWRFYAALAASWVLLALLMRGLHGRGVGFGQGMNTWTYLLIEGGAIMRYLSLAAWPASLVFDYGTELAPIGAAHAICALAIAGLGGGSVYLWQRVPAKGFPGAWFLITLAPTSSLVPIPLQPISENRVYVPVAAVSVALVLLIHGALGRRAALLLCAMAIALGVMTRARNADYRSETSIWADTLAKRPGSSRAHNNLGHALLSAGRIAEAQTEIEAALRINPNYADAHANLASVSGRLGQVDRAIEHSRRATELDPRNANAFYNLGVGLSQKGDLGGAIAAYESSLRFRPDSAEAHGNLSLQLIRTGRAAEAILHAARALQLNPNVPGAAEALGAGFVMTGRWADALPVYTQLVRQEPANANAHFNLGQCHEKVGRTGEAVLEFQAALRLNPNHVAAREALEKLKVERAKAKK